MTDGCTLILTLYVEILQILGTLNLVSPPTIHGESRSYERLWLRSFGRIAGPGREGSAPLAMDGRSDADTALHQLENKIADVAAYEIGAVHADRGETDTAVTWLERAYRQCSLGLVFLKVDPLLRKLRTDPHYKALLRQMNVNLPD